MTIKIIRSTVTMTLMNRTRLVSLRESTITLRTIIMIVIQMTSIWMETTLVRGLKDFHLSGCLFNCVILISVLGYNNSKSLENMNDSDDMDVDVSPMSSKSIKSGIERMLELGRELLQMSLRLEKKYQNVNDEIIAQNRKMMEASAYLHIQQ